MTKQIQTVETPLNYKLQEIIYDVLEDKTNPLDGSSESEQISEVNGELASEIVSKIDPILAQAQQEAVESKQLELAEAQLLGFHHGRWNREDIQGLVTSMGLRMSEWEKMQEMFSMTYLDDEDKNEILEALQTNKGEL